MGFKRRASQALYQLWNLDIRKNTKSSEVKDFKINMVKLETKVKIIEFTKREIQPFCEYIGFFIGGMLGYMSFEGGSKGAKIVKKIFDNYYEKLYGSKQLNLDF